jgi:hypothetical protein
MLKTLNEMWRVYCNNRILFNKLQYKGNMYTLLLNVTHGLSVNSKVYPLVHNIGEYLDLH